MLKEYGWYAETLLEEIENRNSAIRNGVNMTTISVRTDKRLEELIENYLRETDLERSEGIRQLLQNGVYFQAITGFLEGKFSLAKGASLMKESLSDFMDRFAG